MSSEEMEDMSPVELSPVWSILENHGVKLPDYITKLLHITGYGNLHSLSKLNNVSLIQELEEYTTNYLDPSDLDVKEHEERFYFNQRTKKFSILPGHKHLIVNAAETVQKVMQRAQEDYAREHHQEATAEDDEQDDPLADGEDNMPTLTKVRPLHFLADLSNRNSSSTANPERVSRRNYTKRDLSKSPVVPASPNTNYEQEQKSLADYVGTWIGRKVATGQLEPFILDVDYRINVIRPRTPGAQSVYSFVCLRCKTTIKAFKRPNGHSWNGTNICRHLSAVHFLPNAATRMVNARKQNGRVGGSSTPVHDDSASSTPPPLDSEAALDQ